MMTIFSFRIAPHRLQAIALPDEYRVEMAKRTTQATKDMFDDAMKTVSVRLLVRFWCVSVCLFFGRSLGASSVYVVLMHAAPVD
jgi:hypothetical protein